MATPWSPAAAAGLAVRRTAPAPAGKRNTTKGGALLTPAGQTKGCARDICHAVPHEWPSQTGVHSRRGCRTCRRINRRQQRAITTINEASQRSTSANSTRVPFGVPFLQRRSLIVHTPALWLAPVIVADGVKVVVFLMPGVGVEDKGGVATRAHTFSAANSHG